jgi:hypothetical protein
MDTVLGHRSPLSCAVPEALLPVGDLSTHLSVIILLVFQWSLQGPRQDQQKATSRSGLHHRERPLAAAGPRGSRRQDPQKATGQPGNQKTQDSSRAHPGPARGPLRTSRRPRSGHGTLEGARWSHTKHRSALEETSNSPPSRAGPEQTCKRPSWDQQYARSGPKECHPELNGA